MTKSKMCFDFKPLGNHYDMKRKISQKKKKKIEISQRKKSFVSSIVPSCYDLFSPLVLIIAQAENNCLYLPFMRALTENIN